jgi:hypothetical protein
MILMTTLTIALAATPSRASETRDAIDAVWRSQELQLSYRAFQTAYACRDLVYRVTAVLRAVGAREDVRVQTQCSDFSPYQHLRITLATPIPATPENLRLVTTFDATQRLLAEMRSESLPTPADVERFMATRRLVRLTRMDRARFTASDCALMRSISEQLFPKLEVRVGKGGLRCTTEATHIWPTFTVEALVREQADGAGSST